MGNHCFFNVDAFQMKRQITILLILLRQLCFGQENCKQAEKTAINDFKKGNYVFHSLEFQPIENTYLYVLKEDYNIQWRFTVQDSLNYYDCYDSTQAVFLKEKHGNDFLDKARAKADSLEKTENWRKDPEFADGKAGMYKFIIDRLKIEPGDLGDMPSTKVYVQFSITKTGTVEDVDVIKGISDKIDNRLIQIFKEMPEWTPAYLYGKPIRQKCTYPIILDFK